MSAAPDRFERAVAAFRARTLSEGDGEASRVAIVRGLCRQSRRRRGTRLLACALGLALAVPMAHAGWQKYKVLLAERPRPATPPAAQPHKKQAPRSAVKVTPVVTPMAEPAPDEPARATADAPAREPPKAVPRSGSPSEELALYGRAHDLHFHGNDAGKALSAWSLYLTRFPSGQLAPEARYNRAICQVQLGRLEDAKVALSELAVTAPAEHLRTQAKRLLERLESR